LKYKPLAVTAEEF